MTISLNHQIEEVKREIDMRKRTYPHLVRKGAMRQGESDLHMGRMLAVLVTLQRLQHDENDPGF